MKKFTVLCLCFLVLASCLLFSCKNNSGGDVSSVNNTTDSNYTDTGNSDTAVNTDNTGGTENRNDINDNLPVMDFGGYTFNILTGNDPIFVENLAASEDTGDVINDAFYRANRTVEDRFNINIKVTQTGDVFATDTAKKSINSGDNSFDLLFGHDYATGAASLDGYFVNLYSLSHLDFSKPWWPKNTVDSLTFDGKMFIFSNSMTTLGLDWMRLLFINKGMAANMGITVPYKDVYDGTWTLEKLTQMTKDAYTDVNGDGKKDKEDTYGYGFTGPYYCSIEPFGIHAVKKSGNTLELDINNERTQKMVDMMYNLMVDSQGTFFDGSDENICVNMFAQNKCLIILSQLKQARMTLRASDINYGILPFPKLDESQESYYAGYNDRLFAVPKTASDLDRTAVIIEAMSAEGWKKVFPAYYEIAMKNKYLADDDSIKILDMIYSSRVLSFDYIYGIKYYMMLNDLLNTKKPSKDFASYYDKSVGAVEKVLKNIEDKFAALN